MGTDPKIDSLTVTAFEVPTDAPESDGTFAWDSTTMILVEATAGGITGLGYTYAGPAAGLLASTTLSQAVLGLNALHTGAAFSAMMQAVRNLGRDGIAATAISAVDAALWDLKGGLLGLPVADLLGRVHAGLPLYGSGGFTSYDSGQLRAQLGGWAEEGLPAVKMKVGRDLHADPQRMREAREAIGDNIALFVDANGALTRKEALAFAETAAREGVTWFEEPVSSNDLEGLRLLRDRGPAGMAISAGEYGYDIRYFRRMLAAGAVDVLQADMTRCGGVTGFLKAAALAEAAEVPLSSHCAPALHVHACAAAAPTVHMEWFHDHVRIEAMLFDGAPAPRAGRLEPTDAPGFGLTLKRADAERFRIKIGA